MTSKLTEEIYQDLKDRSKRGLQKYGHYLEDNNYQDMLQHSYEEVLDLAQYLKKEINNRNTIQQLIKMYPNDSRLGEVVREIFTK
tara:strand:- start:239 stop:493 length:255 start_codon:yes stop_codon:yes gene_type:complete